MQEINEFGIVGLGRMGSNLARQALEKGMKVAGYTLIHLPADLEGMGLIPLHNLNGFRDVLQRPRAVFLYVPAGPVVDNLIEAMSGILERGDIIVDGGNSYWGDSVKRYEHLWKQGIHFVDLGTSGGIQGARSGACFMAGGEDEPVGIIEPILKRLAVPEGYVHAGPPGAGHFTKLVHNGVEFGMLEAIAEGVDLLSRSRMKLNVAEVLNCWRHGSVVRSWLLDLMEKGYRQQGGLGGVSSYVDDTGEVNWLLADALEMEAPIPAIATSLMQLLASRDVTRNWARAVAVMRNGFGGHSFGKNPAAEQERRFGRVGDIMRSTPEKKTTTVR